MQISFDELKSTIEDWNIKERIRQKISIWGIKNTTRKIKAMPTEFLTTALLYYFLKCSGQIVQNYHDQILTEVSNQLKNIYNQSSIDFFKKETNFQYTFVILAKLINYFIVSYFPEKKLNSQSLENEIYIALVSLLIGYEVGSNTYRIVQLKYKKKNTITMKNKSNNSYKLIREINSKEEIQKQQDYIVPSTSYRNIIHRRGIHGFLQETNREGEKIEIFKGQVRDALKVRLVSKAISIKTIKSPKQIPTIKQNSQQCLRKWVKSKNKVMYVNQISAAMSINKGFNSPRNEKAHIYLTERANIKEPITYRKNNLSNIKLTSINRSQIALKKPKYLNWERIIDEMKQQSYCLNSSSNIQNPGLNQFNLKKQPPNIRMKTQDNSNTLTASDAGQLNIKFKKVQKHQEMSTKCDPTTEPQLKPVRYKSVQKLKSILFLQDQVRFEQACDKRQRQLISPPPLFLPKINQH